MSADEVVTRVRQEASKRLDLARFRCGLNGRPLPVHLTTAAHPVFFFDRQQIPQRVSLLRKYLPGEVNTVIREADEILRHKFNLLGYEGLDYGSEIDWHLDAVHQKRAPLKPWFKVPFLEFSEVGDHKVTWELNRHQHLVTLAKARCFTSENEYAVELVQQWYQWQKKNPYPLGINWASALEVAFRSLSWLWVRHLLAGCSDLPQSFHADLLEGLRQNGRYIGRYHSKYFSPNTHLLGEAVALLYIGVLCPQIPEANSWREWGWDTVVHESARQVRRDGVYFEQSLYYHVYALDLFLYARALAARNGFVVPENLDDTLTRMLDFLLAVCEGNGEGFGDDDGGRIFNPRRNRIEHLSDPLALGAAEYQRLDWGSASGLTEEAVWLFGESALAACTRKPLQSDAGGQAFESGGVYLIRDNEPFPQQMMIDAGPMGADTCGHGHADALSIRLSLDGHRCLIDPGTFVYMSAGDDRSRFRGTGAHNTVRLDGLDQANPLGPFAWTSITTTKLQRWLAGETFSLCEAQHDGYQKLPDPVVHRRMVFHINGAFSLVRDILEGAQTHAIEGFWHFSPEFRVEMQSGQIMASLMLPAANDDARDSKLHLLSAQPSIWHMEIESGEISPVYGFKQKAPVVRVHATVALPAECALLLVPLAGQSTPGRCAQLEQDKRSPKLSVYEYQMGSGTYLIFCSGGDGSWTWKQWSSDARILCCQIAEGQLKQIALIAGTFARWQNTTLFRHPQRVDRFEWLSSHGQSEAFSSDPEALRYVDQKALAELHLTS